MTNNSTEREDRLVNVDTTSDGRRFVICTGRNIRGVKIVGTVDKTHLRLKFTMLCPCAPAVNGLWLRTCDPCVSVAMPDERRKVSDG